MNLQGLGWVNIVLGFQPTADYAGTVAAPQRVAPQAPKLSWMDRLDRWFWRLELEERDAYLAEAVDIVDLEQRLRSLERRREPFIY